MIMTGDRLGGVTAVTCLTGDINALIGLWRLNAAIQWLVFEVLWEDEVEWLMVGKRKRREVTDVQDLPRFQYVPPYLVIKRKGGVLKSYFP